MSILHFTTVQTNLFWEDKAANLQQLENKIVAIPTPRAVVILPEMLVNMISKEAKFPYLNLSS